MIKKLIKYTFNGYLFALIWCVVKGWYYTARYVNGNGRIVFSRPFLKLRITKAAGARIELNGNLILTSHCNGRGCVSIQMGENSLLQIRSEFSLGQNNKIHISSNGSLIAGGKVNESSSGITCDSMIMCYNNITIGEDFICGWNVYISDSDWHTVLKDGIVNKHHTDVAIGNHVWIGSNVIIGKGTIIGDNCIVGAYTKLANKSIADGSTIVGSPAKVISTTTTWERDI